MERHHFCEEDGLVPRSMDRLLIDEVQHRIANEVASALAAMRLARSARGQRSRTRMIDIAIDRLEGFGECSRIMSNVGAGDTDAGALIERVCRAMTRSRVADGPANVVLNLQRVMTDGESARRLAMIAYELINNALKHAFGRAGGELEVRLERLLDGIVLSIIDDGPGLGAGRTTAVPGCRLGGGIVGDLVRASRGSLECDTGPSGTAVHVMISEQPAF